MASEQSGERQLQREMGSYGRASRFYERQLLNSLNERMIGLIERQEMFFVSTADASGNCDCSPRFGAPGFVRVIDSKTLAYPEFRGNGVFASLGNILENPHVGMLFVDFFNSTVGLHVNGEAQISRRNQLPPHLVKCLAECKLPDDRLVEAWVLITVEEAYIHCSKHVPQLKKLRKSIDWGTDDPVAKSNDYFVESETVGSKKS
jgi:predicted pyridoxine 5'-phosphate oxidase superfamily flavin-nucleotide-binding protein